ncbi:BTAD domain-containing putative transcriptional regulator [Kitasatospora sp. NPDC052896]|uniref:AfsR/SARP family transcriptional regulator n=1 Tax=Kitasatospora sp. NPDC052896 TaxID=3364061 RepID=UPI0037C849E3
MPGPEVDGGPLQYELLGPLRVHRAGVESALGPAMQRAVLAVLLLNANEPVSREQLVQAVWGARSTGNSPGLVATYVSRLRRVVDPGRTRRSLGGVLATEGAGYRLLVEPGCLDLRLFEAARARAREQRAAGDLAGCEATLEGGLASWRGAPLDGLPGPYAALHRGRLVELRLAAQEERFELALLLGRHHEVVAELGLLAAAHPLRERLRGLLMLALYRAGRQGEALAVFAETRHQLVAELGLEPGRELDELHQRILRADPELEPGRPAAMLAGPARPLWRPAQLPSEPADFTGRVAEVRALRRILAPDRRPATVPVAVLTGPPGIGKTALAAHTAHLLRERFPDGQLWAALHDAAGRPRSPGRLLGRLLTDLGVEPGALPVESEQRAALFRSVTWGRRLLLVLDDAADAAQVTAVLPGAPSCAVLVTGRGRALGPAGARVVPLGGLGPAEAGRLLRRAAAVGAGTGEADGPAAEAVLAVCAGWPLALRAAAARVAARPGRGLAGLAERLTEETRWLAELGPGGGGVVAALVSAERRLRRGPAGPAAAAAFRRLCRSGGTRFLGPTVAGELEVDAPRAEELLDLLAEHGLLRPEGDGEYHAHSLTACYGRSGEWTANGIRMSWTRPPSPGRPG